MNSLYISNKRIQPVVSTVIFDNYIQYINKIDEKGYVRKANPELKDNAVYSSDTLYFKNKSELRRRLFNLLNSLDALAVLDDFYYGEYDAEIDSMLKKLKNGMTKLEVSKAVNNVYAKYLNLYNDIEYGVEFIVEGLFNGMLSIMSENTISFIVYSTIMFNCRKLTSKIYYDLDKASYRKSFEVIYKKLLSGDFDITDDINASLQKIYGYIPSRNELEKIELDIRQFLK